MTIEQLKQLLKDGKFHHATYRTETCWRGLHIYGNQNNGFNGFILIGSFSAVCHDPHICDYAYYLVRHTGVSLGAYGQG